MLYGDDVFIHIIIETFWCGKWTLLNTIVFFCNKVAIFMKVLLWRPIWPKITQKCVYGDELFLSTKALKHPSPIDCVLHNQSRHFRHLNAAFMHHFIKVWWTIQDILLHT